MTKQRGLFSFQVPGFGGFFPLLWSAHICPALWVSKAGRRFLKSHPHTSQTHIPSPESLPKHCHPPQKSHLQEPSSKILTPAILRASEHIPSSALPQPNSTLPFFPGHQNNLNASSLLEGHGQEFLLASPMGGTASEGLK